MKVVLLAGGLGSRITEESQYRPKPMVELGGMPILWHIMKEYFLASLRSFLNLFDRIMSSVICKRLVHGILE